MKFAHKISLFLFISVSLFSTGQIIPFISEKSLSPSEKYSVQVWTTENGLPQNSINDIIQTKDGYLWLATFDGLVQFDGIKFKIFRSSTTPELKTNGIKKLFVDKLDRLWIISSDGRLYSYYKNKFHSYDLPEKTLIYSNMITNWTQTSILIACENNKIYSIDNNVISEFRVPLYIQHLNTIISKYDDQLYIGASNGLFSFSGNIWYTFPEFKNQIISTFYRSPNNDILTDIGTYLLVVHPRNTELLNLPISLKEIGNHGIGFNQLQQMVILSEKGLYTIVENKTIHTSIENGLSSNGISSVYADKQNNFWVGTSNGGLNKLKEKLFHTLSKENGMNDDGITGLLQTSKGNILLANNCSGLSNYLNKKFVPSFQSVEGDCLWSLMEDKNKNIWVGSYGDGIAVFKENNEIKHYRISEGLSSNVVFALYTDSKNMIWCGTDKGLCFLENDKFVQLDISFKNTITYIFEDRNKQLFLCSDIGLATIRNQKIVLLQNGELGNTNLRYIYEDKEGVLWLGTHGSGLIRFKNGSTFSYTSKNAALDNNVWSITEDSKGNFWLPSNSGMYVIERKELNEFADGIINNLSPIYLSKEDGLKSSEFNGGFQPTVLQNEMHELWFPTVKGVAIANPANLKPVDYFPQIVIEKIALDDELITLTDSILTSVSSNSLLISFSAPSFINPSKLNFQYKIEGIDNSWVDIGSARELKLNSIPSGNHILRLKVAGNINNKETSILLIKPLPIWKETKFITALSFIFLLIVLIATVGIIGVIRKRERKKTLLNKQYANIELKALQAQMNPHFIFNCLNSIQHFIIVNDEISANKYLSKFSMLMRKFLEHSKFNTISLHEEIELIRLYIELENLRFKEGFDLTMEIDPAIDKYNIEIPSMLFHPFVENAINHGLLNLDRKGNLKIIFRLEKQCLLGIIEDDGIGRKKSSELRSETRKDHQSRGMEITKDRISVLNKMENTNIEVEIIDKTNDTYGSSGTLVIIKIPI